MALKLRRQTAARCGGMTLAEVLMAMAAIGIIALVIPQLLLGTYRFLRLSQTRLEVQRDSRSIMSIIETSVREASADTVTLTRHDAGEPPYSKIEFTNVDGETIRIYQSDGALYLEKGAQRRTLTGDLRFAAFAYAATTKDALLSAALCLEKTAYSGTDKNFFLSVQKMKVGNE